MIFDLRSEHSRDRRRRLFHFAHIQFANKLGPSQSSRQQSVHLPLKNNPRTRCDTLAAHPDPMERQCRRQASLERNKIISQTRRPRRGEAPWAFKERRGFGDAVMFPAMPAFPNAHGAWGVEGALRACPRRGTAAQAGTF